MGTLRYRLTRLTALIVACIAAGIGTAVRTRAADIRVKAPAGLAACGTVSVRIRTERGYANGLGRKRIRIPLVSLPGVAECTFRQTESSCALDWAWKPRVKNHDLRINLPELPAGEWFYLLYTWDAKAGRFEGYVNGVPLRLPGTALTPWKLAPVKVAVFHAGTLEMADPAFTAGYVSATAAASRVPVNVRGRHGDLFGMGEPTTPLQVDNRLGKVLYESPLARPADVDGWRMEGPGKLSFEDGWMRMSSKRPHGPVGHIVYWCPRDFPDRFVAEWEVQPVSDYGLCIVFFAARGKDGQDIFDKSLPKRTGNFRDYIRGAINCYHMSYYANTPFNPGRITCNMRKNSGFFLVTNGPPGIPPGSKSVHRIRLIKDGAHSQLQVDGRVIIDFTDDGRRYGPVLHGGRIGFRQMQWMVAQYRNLRVRELKPR